MDCFFNKVPFSERLTDNMLPAKDTEFDANAFSSALEAYMQVQKDNKRGNLTQKEALMNQLKDAAKDLSSFDKKQDLQNLLLQSAYKLSSRFFWMDTAGSTLLYTWLEKLNEDPNLKEAAAQREQPHKVSILGIAYSRCK